MTRSRRNRFASFCSSCGDRVAAGEGHLLFKDPGSGYWRVHCEGCERASSRAWREPPRYAYPPPYAPHIPGCLMTLGLTPPVDREAVRRRFRELALLHHPDHGGRADRFIEIRRAYSEAIGIAGGGA